MKPAIERTAPAAVYLPSQATRFISDAAPDSHLTLVIPASRQRHGALAAGYHVQPTTRHAGECTIRWPHARF